MLKVLMIAFFALFFSGAHAKSPRLLYVESPIYIGGAGLFHNFNIVLGCLDLYDRYDYIAVKIDFGDQGLYYESSYGPNWWNYYFEPGSYPQRSNSKRKPLLKRLQDEEKAEIGNAVHFYMKRERAHELIAKYVRVKQEFLEEVEAFYKEHLEGSFIIGVHYRGTDKWFEANRVSHEEVFSKVEAVMAAHKYVKIFVATDESSFLEKMKERFGKNICYIEAQRFDGHPVHYISNKCFLKGKEALIDCLLLAKSDVLIRTNSNLSAVSAYFNPNMEVFSLNTVNDFLYRGISGKGVLNELNAR